MADPKGSKSRTTRRQILGKLGAGTGVFYLGTGIAGADPGLPNRENAGHPNADRGGGVGQCTCEEDCADGYYCGKVEGPPELGKTYTFTSDGEAYSVTIESVTTKEDNEITCFSYSANDDIEKVCVKGGPDTATYQGSPEEICAPVNPGGQQAAISNFSFCGKECTCYQVDFVWWDEDYPLEALAPDDRYGSNLIQAYHNDTCNDDGPRTDNGPHEWDSNGCPISNVKWVEGGGTLSVEFELDCEEAGVEVGLVSYEDDCEYEDLTKMDLDDQNLVDFDYDEFQDDGSLTVDIPS